MNDELKRALGSVFLRDVRTIEPKKKGVIVGENLRLYEEKKGFVLSFLRGTDERTRGQFKDKLETAGLSYSLGDDFSL